MTLHELREMVFRLESAQATRCDDLRRVNERLTALRAKVLKHTNQLCVHDAEQRVAAARREVTRLEIASEQKRHAFSECIERYLKDKGSGIL